MDLSINEGTLVVSGGPGDSMHSAIVIRKTHRGLSAAGAEHLLLVQRYGRRAEGWNMKSCDLVQDAGRTFDVYVISLADGAERRLYFDITDWLTNVKHSV